MGFVRKRAEWVNRTEVLKLTRDIRTGESILKNEKIAVYLQPARV